MTCMNDIDDITPTAITAAGRQLVPDDEVAVLRFGMITTLDLDVVQWGLDGEPLRHESGLLRHVNEAIEAVQDAATIVGFGRKGGNVFVNGEHVTHWQLITVPIGEVTAPADRSPVDAAIEGMFALADGMSQVGEAIVDEAHLPDQVVGQIRTTEDDDSTVVRSNEDKW